MNAQKRKQKSMRRRRLSVRRKVAGTAQRPRLTIHRSLKAMYAQIIDDIAGHTLAAALTSKLEDAPTSEDGGPSQRMLEAKALGGKVAALAKDKGVTAVCFDRGPYKYHGRVKAFAEGAREGGLKF